MSTRVARHLIVRGGVQGVFFRASMRDVARRAGVTGWVRNRVDGRVEAHLEGTAGAVEQVEVWVRAGGPPGAAVTEVVADDASPTGATTFDIQPTAGWGGRGG